MDAKDWELAKAHLDEYIRLYLEIGSSGALALQVTLMPLKARYDRGERSRDLYEAMMAVE